ncbi:MAG: alpha/beta hydrolase [Terracidiphilus sp.]
MNWIAPASLAAAAAALPMVLLVNRYLHRRRTTAALRIGSANGISEERFVKIGGIEQWIGIRGEYRDNPVLLIVHGGPGSSCSIFTPLIRSWERHFTVVQWDQRGGGKTLRRNGQGGTGSLTMNRLIEDGIEAAEFLCSHLRQKRIVLMAASFGSTFGLSMVRRRPDLFSAYVGSDQNVGLAGRGARDHQAAIERLRALGLHKGVAALERIGLDPGRWSAKDFFSAARWEMRSEPRTCARIMKLLRDSIWFSPAHTLLDIKYFFTGMNYSIEQLFPEVPGFDAWREGVHFDVPFFIFQGENDVLTPTASAEAFFVDVVAPVKEMALIRDAGHFAAFLQPEQFLRELLARVRPVVVSADRSIAASNAVAGEPRADRSVATSR